MDAKTDKGPGSLPADVLMYALGPMSARWGRDSVQKVLKDLKVRILSAEDVRKWPTRKVKGFGDIFKNPLGCGQNAFLWFEGKSPVLCVRSGHEHDSTLLMTVLAQAVQRKVLRPRWFPAFDVRHFTDVLHASGFHSTNIRGAVHQVLKTLWWFRPDQLVAKMETLNYLKYRGYPESYMRSWLKSVTPEAVSHKVPGMIDYLMAQFHLPPETLRKAGWPFPAHQMKREFHAEAKPRLYSVVSVPKEGLDPEVWETGETPHLKAGLREELLERLMTGLRDAGYRKPEAWVARALLIGSTTGNQYDEDSDIDVTVVIDPDAFRREELDRMSPERLKSAMFETAVAPSDMPLREAFRSVTFPSIVRYATLMLEGEVAGNAMVGLPVADRRRIQREMAEGVRSVDAALKSGEVPVLEASERYGRMLRRYAAHYGLPDSVGDRLVREVRSLTRLATRRAA